MNRINYLYSFQINAISSSCTAQQPTSNNAQEKISDLVCAKDPGGRTFLIYNKQIPYRLIAFSKFHYQIHNDNITTDNREFIKEVVHDKYGAKTIIKGVETYQNPVSESLLKFNEEHYPVGEWHPYVKRTGAIARKIGVVPLWRKNGEKIWTTMLQVFEYFISGVNYSTNENQKKP